MNPADLAIKLVSTEFDSSSSLPLERKLARASTSGSSTPFSSVPVSKIDRLAVEWVDRAREFSSPSNSHSLHDTANMALETTGCIRSRSMASTWRKTLVLAERNYLNYSRNVLAFGIRCKHPAFLPFLNLINPPFFYFIVGMYSKSPSLPPYILYCVYVADEAFVISRDGIDVSDYMDSSWYFF